MFIMIDGVDGSGKTTIVRCWREMFEARGERLFDAVAFEKRTGRIPTLADAGNARIIISGEPTYAGVGKILRDTMLRNGAPFTARQITEAFAEQRRELYEALIIPALALGVHIVQDRGISTSLAYQPTMSSEVTESFVTTLPGNILALEHRPDTLVLCAIPPDTALARLAGRAEKNDDAIFEKRDYVIRLVERFNAPSWKKFLEDRGTKIISFNADQPLALAIRDAQRLLADLLY